MGRARKGDSNSTTAKRSTKTTMNERKLRPAAPVKAEDKSKEIQKKKPITLSKENPTFPENGKYVHYDVCVLMKDHFEHKEFESLELAEKYAIKMSKALWSVSLHKCEFEAKNCSRKEIKSELMCMYFSGEKCE
jgi:hypothetical protein